MVDTQIAELIGKKEYKEAIILAQSYGRDDEVIRILDQAGNSLSNQSKTPLYNQAAERSFRQKDYAQACSFYIK